MLHFGMIERIIFLKIIKKFFFNEYIYVSLRHFRIG